ncbi:TPA: UDP-N-acetylglucosamine 2-epimerase (hydrolyzing) [Enterococcus faecium]|nr:UDP-N-acetylglucosamine 2-epimerase (hydrolyzing) [Enterococcus faecium]HDL2085321.1 UDP-N-acetylglucosamine 2-epimerase (hydrolyzing) [Enterococcus faecium]HDL2655940.1 UDP-N-acetylglucosamine 2-epimerase (hydrolyzing) [Enterococcus faecium]HDL2699520.1 UDP-N-acetylglucosamine 2-epimerase (hydrolyzing) [Enterococcus faecium]HDL2788512.1 UDP-N-acetylglucosamine 2-epimerase (hydrolyzing) [Enterococcus faecium]
MKKILIVSGTRADYGIYKPVAENLLQDNWDVSFVVSGMHLSHKYGFTKELILADGFRISGEVQSLFLENNKGNMARSVALEINGFTNIFEQTSPDFVLLLGDRGEMLAAAIACLYLGIKTAHIHGGEVSGTVDESIRHAITKIASVHFAATEKSKERLIKMGEDSWRVFPVGAPRIDTILNNRLPSFRDIKEKYHLKFEKKKYVLQVFHPVVTELENIEKQILALINSMEQQSQPIIGILPNSDAGSEIIRKMYQKYLKTDIIYITNLEPEEYLTILKECKFMIGNSSSGIIEAASFKIPVINLGTRQNGREQSKNIINANLNENEIETALNKIQDPQFIKSLKNVKNIYGDGNSSRRITKTLNQILNDGEDIKWIQKQIAY